MTNVQGTGNSIVGQYGSMPIDMLMRKQEVTCGYEDPDLVNNHMRELMKDFRPDKPFLASDEARGGVDDRGTDRGGYQSTQSINLRSGARTLDDPYLPDGTFLDHQFMEKDPRGVALGPDMRKHVDQQYARASFIKHYDDSDNSVPESGWNPWKAQMQIRNAQNRTKDYFKIFDTAKDGRGNGGMAPGYAVSNIQKIQEGQVIKDPNQAPNVNRIDITNNLSNDTSIGWRRTTDHRFNVAKYGKTNTSKSFTSEDWYKNRSNVDIDHDIYVSWQDSNMLKSTALLMMDLSRRKETNQFTGLNGVNFGTSEKTVNKKHKLTPSDMSGMQARPTKETRTEDAHTDLNGEQAPSSGSKLMLHDVKNIEKTHINPTIVEKMSNINKRTTKKSKDDLRKSIHQSAEDMGVYRTYNNKKTVQISDPSILWKSISAYKKGESKTVKNYKAAVRQIEEGGKKLERVDKNIDFKDSIIGNQRRGKLLIEKSQDVNTALIDNDYGSEVVRSHLVGPMGSKYMNKFMDTDTDQNDINDSDKSYGN